jgi:hypothetical protein
MGRLKHIHLVLMLGISLLIPIFLAYSLYVELLGTVLLSSDMSFEDPEDEDLSTSQNDFKNFAPAVFSNPLLSRAHFSKGYGLFSSPLMSYTEMAPVLRC